jgi:hypothetical protein
MPSVGRTNYMGITKEIVLGPKEVAVVTSVALTEQLQN